MQGRTVMKNAIFGAKTIILTALFYFTTTAQSVDKIDINTFVYWDNSFNFYICNGTNLIDTKTTKKLDYSNFPRPKLRNGNIWYSDGKIIVKQPNQDNYSQQNTKIIIKFPKELKEFSEFDIINSENIILFGTLWQKEMGNKFKDDIENLDFCVIFNIESEKFEKTLIKLDKNSIKNFNDLITKTTIMSYYQYPNIVFIEKFSGKSYIYDMTKKEINTTELLEHNELANGFDSINNGPVIEWASPITTDNTLILAKIWMPGDKDKGTENTKIPIYRTYNFSEKKKIYDSNNFMSKQVVNDTPSAVYGDRFISINEIIEHLKIQSIPTKQNKIIHENKQD